MIHTLNRSLHIKLYKIITIIFLICIGTQASAQVKSAQKLLKEVNTQISNITVEALETKMKNQEYFILIDIRTEKEYLCGHIQNAKWIPRGMSYQSPPY